MEADVSSVRRAALRAYERGRALMAAQHAAVAVLIVGAVGLSILGARALVWLPLTATVVVFGEWRGEALAHGMRRGLAAGIATLLLPMTILRPCCHPGETMGVGECCESPNACVAAGAIVGLLVAAFLPMRAGSRIRAAVGMMLGMLSVACLKCDALLLGEAAGLLGGLAGGIIAVSLARTLLDRRKAVG